MALGAFYHTALIYNENIVWRVSSEQSSGLLQFISATIHEFRMEAFFLISGFFFLLLFEKQQDSFLRQRLQRVIIPLIVCGLTLNILMNFLSYNLSIDWSLTGYFLNGVWLGHLWFLGNLATYFVVFFIILKLAPPLPTLSRRAVIVLLFLFTPVLSIGLKWLVSDFNNVHFLFFTPAKWIYQAPYFLLGILFYRSQASFLQLFTKRGLSLALVLLALLKIIKREMALSGWDYSITSSIDELTTPLLVYSVLGFFLIFLNKSSRAVRAMSDSSYTVYLLHQPLIIVIYSLIYSANLGFNIYLEYILIVALSLSIPFAFHVYIVKHIAIFKLLLNGVYVDKKGYKRKAGTIS